LDEPILRIDGLRAEYVTTDGAVQAVNNVSLSVGRGQTLALMGESGSGKTSVGLCILNLLPHPGRITGGRVLYEGRDLLELAPEEMRHIRGRDIAMVFQDPSSGLNRSIRRAGSRSDATLDVAAEADAAWKYWR
jgi:ABC-type glutathione transport system ATPase component